MLKIKRFDVSFRVVSGLLVMLLFFFTIAACNANFLEPREEDLGTDSETDRGFHVVADEPQGFGLRFPWIIVGIEKTKRQKIGVPALEVDPHLSSTPDGFNEQNTKELRSKLDDGKRTFVLQREMTGVSNRCLSQ